MLDNVEKGIKDPRIEQLKKIKSELGLDEDSDVVARMIESCVTSLFSFFGDQYQSHPERISQAAQQYLQILKDIITDFKYRPELKVEVEQKSDEILVRFNHYLNNPSNWSIGSYHWSVSEMSNAYKEARFDASQVNKSDFHFIAKILDDNIDDINKLAAYANLLKKIIKFYCENPLFERNNLPPFIVDIIFPISIVLDQTKVGSDGPGARAKLFKWPEVIAAQIAYEYRSANKKEEGDKLKSICGRIEMMRGKYESLSPQSTADIILFRQQDNIFKLYEPEENKKLTIKGWVEIGIGVGCVVGCVSLLFYSMIPSVLFGWALAASFIPMILGWAALTCAKEDREKNNARINEAASKSILTSF